MTTPAGDLFERLGGLRPAKLPDDHPHHFIADVSRDVERIAREEWPEFSARRRRDPARVEARVKGWQRATVADRWEWRRAERWRSIVIVLRVLLWHVDLVTLRARKRDATSGAVLGLTVDQLAELAGLSADQVERSIADLHAAGFVVSYQHREPYTNDDGIRAWDGYPAVRCVTAHLFRRLGCLAAYHRIAAKAYARRKKAARRERRDPGAFAFIRQTAGPRPGPRRGAPSSQAEPQGLEWQQLLFAVRAERPDLSGDEIRAEARRRWTARRQQ